MARETSAALARIGVLATLTLVLASCGGGSTGGPVAQTGVAAATAARTVQAQPAVPSSSSRMPQTTPAAPRRAAAAAAQGRAARPHAAHRRRSGGAAAPSEPAGAGSLADAPAATAVEPSTPAPEEAAAQPPPQPAATPLDERADLILTRRITNTHYFQQGTVTGTYDGTMATEARITAKGVLVRFTATLPGGTISGRAVAVAILDSATWPGLRGRAIVTGGTGRFAGIRGRGLRVTGRSKPDASHTRVRLAGMVRL